jgi:hypothetical protein
MNTYRCMSDGFEFSGSPVLLPKRYDSVKNEFIYDNVVFCSPSCLKGWVYRDINIHGDNIQLISLYIHKVLGIDASTVDICPDPQFIDAYMFDKTKGMSIDTFRSHNEKYIYAMKDKHINPSLNESKEICKVDKSDGFLDKDLYNTTSIKDVTPMEIEK